MLYQACYVKVTACASTKFRFRLNEVHEEYKKDENNIQQAFVNFFCLNTVGNPEKPR